MKKHVSISLETAEFVNGFTEYLQGLALYCLYDLELAEANLDNELVCAAQMDSEVAEYLHKLAENNFDKALTTLKWAGTDV